MRPSPAEGALWRSPVGGLACLLLLALLWYVLLPQVRVTDNRIDSVGGNHTLPWVFGDDTSSRGNWLHLQLHMTPVTPARWNVIPDDSLQGIAVNGRRIPLLDLPANALNDYEQGFDIDLSPWLHPGDNEVEFNLDNGGGDGGLTLRPLLGWRWLPVGLALLAWLAWLGRCFRLGRGQVLVLGAALLPLCRYLAATQWNLRGHDVGGTGGGHLAYIIYIATHHALPSPDAGWTFYHPPLYYLLGALVWSATQWAGLPADGALQLLGLVLWLVFLAASAGALRLGLPRQPAALLLATAALALWPGGIVNAVAINNDAGLYAAAGVATWFMLRWWRSQRPRHLFGMAVSIALALLMKGNGMALAAAAVALLGLRLLHRPRWRHALVALLAISIIAAGTTLTLGVHYWMYRHGEIPGWLVGNANQLPDALRVPANVRAFLPLDLPTFLTTPWMDPRDDASGRWNFWNYLLRSALSGEYRFDGLLFRAVAIGWGVLLLWLLGLLLQQAWAWRGSVATVWRQAPWLVLSGCWLLSLMALRVQVPYACSNDFRYVLPVLAPFVLACMRLGRPGQLLLAAISMGSLVFFLWL